MPKTRQPRRKMTFDEKINAFIKRNKLKLTLKQTQDLIECFKTFDMSKHYRVDILKGFIRLGLKFWLQRLRKLSKLKPYAVTKLKLVIRYGKIEGLFKWNHYVELQRKTNTFEYKNSKYGWTREDFDIFNKSRAITLENLSKKYGPEIGAAKYDKYVETQRFAGCKEEYFIEKYGAIAGVEFYLDLNKRKSNSLESYVSKFGEIIGTEKYNNLIISMNKRIGYKCSPISQELFHKIKSESCNFGENGGEFCVYGEEQYYFYDYIDHNLKKCIEFNGDYWHCNPNSYNENDKAYRNFLAKDIWKKDEIKISFLKNLGYNVLIIWESEYKESPMLTIERCNKFLYG